MESPPYRFNLSHLSPRFYTDRFQLLMIFSLWIRIPSPYYTCVNVYFLINEGTTRILLYRIYT